MIFFHQDRGSTRVLKCINKPIIIEKGSLNKIMTYFGNLQWTQRPSSLGVATLPLFICLSSQISVKMSNLKPKYSSSRAKCDLNDLCLRYYALRNQGCYYHCFLITGGPRYSRTFYLRIRLFTLTKRVQNNNFSVKTGLFFCEFKIRGPKWRSLSIANNEGNLYLFGEYNCYSKGNPMIKRCNLDIAKWNKAKNGK